MKYIMAQPAVLRFEWELKVCIHNLLNIGIDKSDIIILFSEHEVQVPFNIRSLGVNVHVYKDDRDFTGYIASLKPYLMYRYLEENVDRENEIYFFMDSDVIFRERIDEELFKKNKTIFYGSDVGSYLNYDYIVNCKNGEELLKDMCEIVGIDSEKVKSVNENTIGAQYIMNKPTAQYFKKVYEDSNSLWIYLKDYETDFQKWVCEMISTFFNMLYFKINPTVHNELDFSWATDSIDKWKECKIYHNAGVTEDRDDLFFKGAYTKKTPFNEGHYYINEEFNSYNYVLEIRKTIEWLNN